MAFSTNLVGIFSRLCIAGCRYYISNYFVSHFTRLLTRVLCDKGKYLTFFLLNIRLLHLDAYRCQTLCIIYNTWCFYVSSRFLKRSPHLSTNHAPSCLILVIEWEPVVTTWHMVIHAPDSTSKMYIQSTAVIHPQMSGSCTATAVIHL
jgi:hypothetical protein